MPVLDKTNNPITANGNYELPGIARGVEQLLVLPNPTYGGGTLTLEYSSNGTTWFPVTDAVWGENGVYIEARYIPPTNNMRLTLSGGSGTISISVINTPISR